MARQGVPAKNALSRLLPAFHSLLAMDGSQVDVVFWGSAWFTVVVDILIAAWG